MPQSKGVRPCQRFVIEQESRPHDNAGCREFATKGGLVEFWTPAEGEPKLGGRLNFLFDGGVAEQTER
jgi:hypothetical protein